MGYPKNTIYMETNKIYQGDCIEELKKMEDIRNKQGEFIKGHRWVGRLGVNTKLRIEWKECKVCGKLFYVGSRNRKNLCCSFKCGAKLSSIKRKEKFIPKGKEVPCKNCNKFIYAEPHRLKDNKQGIFCSKKCYYKFRKGWSNEKMRKALAKGRVTQKGKPKSIKMKQKMSDTYKKKWANLNDREIMMKDRTPEKLKNFREGARKYLEENKGNLPISKIRNRRVIDKIIPNENN